MNPWIRRSIWALVVVIAFGLGFSLRGKPDGQGSSDPSEAKATTWTCSMHPQIQLPGPGDCPICGMDLIPLVQDDGDPGDPRALTLSPSAEKLAEVETAPVERMPVSTTLRLVGKLEADETRVREISAWVSGRIDRLYIDYTGVQVRRGEKLFDLYSPDLYSAQEELLQAVRAAETLRTSPLESMRASADRTVEAARERLRLLGLTASQIAAIEDGGGPSTHVTIVSPISGVVTHKSALVGGYVKTGAHMYSIVDLSRLWLKIDAYEADLAWVRMGQTVAFETDTWPGELFEGTVSFIDPVLDERTRSVKVRVDVPNRDQRLKPGMFARVRIQADVLDEDGAYPLVIPSSAPLLTGNRAVVYVADPEARGRYIGREVALGPQAGDHYVVREGLAEGERVVSRGAFKIDSALQIQARPSMMNPTGGGPPPGHDHGASSPSSTTEEKRPTVSAIAGVPGSFQKQLEEALASYLALADGLSHDDLPRAQEAARALAGRVAGIQHRGLPQEGHSIWSRLAAEVGTGAETVATAADLTAARHAFYPVSLAMIDAVRAFGTTGASPVLVYHCPMARNNQGADWLQSEEGTENPYYGSQMFKCGSQTEVLVSAGDAETQTGHDHR